MQLLASDVLKPLVYRSWNGMLGKASPCTCSGLLLFNSASFSWPLAEFWAKCCCLKEYICSYKGGTNLYVNMTKHLQI